MKANACIFRRTKGAGWEVGVMINEDKLIVDSNGIPVPYDQMWEYKNQEYLGCFLVVDESGAKEKI